MNNEPKIDSQESDYQIREYDWKVVIVFNPFSNIFQYFDEFNQVVEHWKFPSIFDMDRMEKEIFNTMNHDWYNLIWELDKNNRAFWLINILNNFWNNFLKDLREIERSDKNKSFVYWKINGPLKLEKNKKQINSVINNIIKKW